VRPRRVGRGAGFVLLPVVLLLTLIASMAWLASRDTGLNSAMAGGTTDQDKARLAAEAGLQRAIVKMHATGCGGTYPIVLLTPVKDSAFDGASYNAFAFPLSGSPVSLTSTGTYGSASVTLTRANVPMHQAATVTMTLQPGSAGVDTYLKNTGSSQYGGQNAMNAAAGTTFPMLWFDLSTIPAGSQVTAATLSTYAGSGNGSGPVALHRVTRTWTEAANWSTTDGASTPWTTPGGDAVAAPAATTTFNGSGGTWLNWDVTELADRWIKGSLPNQGVQVRVDTAISSLSLASSDDSNATNRPKLAVTFQPPCGWVPPDTTLTLAPLGDLDIDLVYPTLNFGNQPDLWLAHNGLDERVLAQFDSSGVAAGKTVTKATLRLYLGSLNGAAKTSRLLALKAYPVTKPWKELEATWTLRQLLTSWLLAGGDTGSTAAATVNLPAGTAPGTWVEFDITALMQQWVDGVTANNGLALQVSTSAPDVLIFNSREASSNPPQLVVTYH